jgi:hypothetical protein
MIIMMKRTRSTRTVKAAPKIIGLRTQNQDHATTFVSFNTIKTIVRRLQKPIPPRDVVAPLD